MRITDERGELAITFYAKPWWVNVALSALLLYEFAVILPGLQVRGILDLLMGGGGFAGVALSLGLILIILIPIVLSLRLGLRALLWRETVRLGSGLLRLRRGILGLGREEAYAFQHIRHLEATPEAAVYSSSIGDPWRLVTGRNCAFDYGPRTVRFGLRLDEVSTQQVMQAIRERLETGVSASAARAQLPPPKAFISEDASGLRIVVSPARDGARTASFILESCMWAAGEAFLLRVLLVVHSSPMAITLPAVLLLGWSGVGAAWARGWLASRGTQIMTIDCETLSITSKTLLSSRRRSFALRQLGAVHVSLVAPPEEQVMFRDGSIAFDCNGKIRRFGSGIDEPEASQLVVRIRDYLGRNRAASSTRLEQS